MTTNRIPSTRQWTVANAAGYLFSATAPLVANTTNGLHVASLPDTIVPSTVLTQATSGNQLIVDTSNPINGYAGWTMINTTSMNIATGGSPGPGDETILWVGNESSPVFAGYCAAVRMGSSSNGSYLGTVGVLGTWAGRTGNGSPSNSQIGDANTHVYMKTLTCVGGLKQVSYYQDGSLLQTLYADAGYTKDAGFGIGGGINGCVLGTLRYVFFAKAAASLGKYGDKAQIERNIANIFPSLAKNRLIIGVGDSQTAGSNAGSPSTIGNTWISQLPALMANPYDIYFDGLGGVPWGPTAVAGWLTSQMVTAFPLGAAGRFSGLRPRNVIVIWGGTNNLYGSGGTRTTDAPTAYADISTMVASAKANGFDVYVITPLRRTQPNTPATYPADRIILRNLIIANAANATGILDLDTDPRFDNPDDATYFQTSLSGVHLNIVGNGIVANMVAALVGNS